MSAAQFRYKRWALMPLPRPDGRGIPVLLQGGPLDGLEEMLPPYSDGVMSCQTWPDGGDGELDYFYPLPEPRRRRRIGGRIICRFSRRKVRA
jgi:hypothetical protein